MRDCPLPSLVDTHAHLDDEQFAADALDAYHQKSHSREEVGRDLTVDGTRVASTEAGQ